MERSEICDIIYGQNWIDQTMIYRRVHSLNPVYQTNCDDVNEFLWVMGRRDYTDGRLFVRRSNDYGRLSAITEYVLMR